MGNNLGSLFAAIGLDVDSLERDLRRAEKAFSDLGASTKTILDQIGTREERLKRETAAYKHEIEALASQVARSQAQLKLYQSDAGQALLKQRAELNSQIERTVKQAEAQIAGANSGLGQMKSLLSGVAAQAAAVAAAYLSWQAISGFVTSSLAEWAAQEKATNRLAFTLRRLGVDVGGTMSQIESLSKSFMRQMGIADELVTEGYNRLIIAGYDVARSTEIMTTALDLASQTGDSLDTVLDALIKAGAGSTMQLNRLAASLGIAVADGASLSDVLSEIKGKIGGAALVEMRGYGGSVKELSIAWIEAKEAVGEFMASTLGLTRILQFIAHPLDHINAAVHKWDAMMYGLVGRHDLAAYHAVKAYESIYGAIVPVTAEVKKLFDLQKAFGAGPQSALDDFLKPIVSAQNKLSQLSKLTPSEPQFRLRDLTPDTSGIKRILAETAAIEAQANAVRENQQKLAAHAAEIEAWGKTWEGWLSNLDEQTRKLAESMTQAFEDNFFSTLEGEFKSLSDLVKSIVSDMTRYIEQELARLAAQNLTKGIFGLFGGGASSIGSVLSDQDKIAQLAVGGMVTTPTLALIGESGPEAVVPMGQINNPAFWESIGAGGYARGGDTIHVTMNIATPDLPSFRASQSQLMAELQVRAGTALRRNR